MALASASRFASASLTLNDLTTLRIGCLLPHSPQCQLSALLIRNFSPQLISLPTPMRINNHGSQSYRRRDRAHAKTSIATAIDGVRRVHAPGRPAGVSDEHCRSNAFCRRASTATQLPLPGGKRSPGIRCYGPRYRARASAGRNGSRTIVYRRSVGRLNRCTIGYRPCRRSISGMGLACAGGPRPIPGRVLLSCNCIMPSATARECSKFLTTSSAGMPANGWRQLPNPIGGLRRSVARGTREVWADGQEAAEDASAQLSGLLGAGQFLFRQPAPMLPSKQSAHPAPPDARKRSRRPHSPSRGRHAAAAIRRGGRTARYGQRLAAPRFLPGG